MIDTGRGAWSRTGRGGTLRKSRTRITPGPHYLMHSDPNQTIGLRAYLLKTVGMPVEQDYLATFHAVVGIQALCANYLERPIMLDGLFEAKTHQAVLDVQAHAGLTHDGIVGPGTMAKLVEPVAKGASKAAGVRWSLTFALMQNESALDPGAIGVLDPNDWGLAQINSLANPHISFSDAMCPSFATRYVANRLKISIAEFGDERDAIASYNLGIGGTRQWIAAGRPDVWQPPYADAERNVKVYIDRIFGLAAQIEQ